MNKTTCLGFVFVVFSLCHSEAERLGWFVGKQIRELARRICFTTKLRMAKPWKNGTNCF